MVTVDSIRMRLSLLYILICPFQIYSPLDSKNVSRMRSGAFRLISRLHLRKNDMACLIHASVWLTIWVDAPM